MKLKNKKTGEIVEVESLYLTQNQELQLTFTDEKNERKLYMTDKISTFENEWEDYEDPKEYWCIDWTEIGGIYRTKYEGELDDFNKQIGNYFKTKEEAGKAVKKLKAWKRLKDKGFRFERWQFLDNKYGICVQGNLVPDIVDELDILFGGEE